MTKILHFACGLLVSIAVAGMFFKWDTSADTAIIQAFEGFIGALLAGLGKEAIDFFRGSEFDAKDWLATIIGGIIGSMIWLI